MKLNKEAKLLSEQSKYKKHCRFCGHSLSFYAYEKDRKVCSWCGNYNYRDGLVEFKYLLEKERKRLKNASKDKS